MLSTMDPEVMNSLNSDLNWKNITKGRRSRRSVARNFNGDAEFGGTGRGCSTSRRSGNVPVKEINCLKQLQSWISSSYCENSLPTPLFPSTISLDKEKHMCPTFSSGDFSGIELLAAAASMEDDLENAGKEDISENIIAPRSSDAASFTSQSKGFVKPNESETSSSDMTMLRSNSECTLFLRESADASKTKCSSPKDDAMPKVSRRHWDLNTLMDTWVEPFDSNVNGGPLEERGNSKDQLLSSPIGKADIRMEETKPSVISLDRACSVPPYLVECAPGLPCSSYSDVTGVCSNQATAKDNDDMNHGKGLGCDSHLETSKQLMKADVALGSSIVNKLACSSGMLMQSEKINTVSDTILKLRDEDGLSNTNVCNETIVSAGARRNTQDANVCDLLAIEASESMNGVLSNDSKDSKMASRVSSATYSVQITRSFTHERPHNDGENNSDTVELVLMHRDNSPTTDEAEKITPSGAEAQCDHSDVSFAMIDLTLDTQNVHEVFHKRDHIGGLEITKHSEEYDSSYEDGELRASSSCSWEDNEMENECIDYESNGRKGDGPVGVDHNGYEIGEDDSEGSHSNEGRSLLLSRFPEGPTSKYESVTHYSRRHHFNNNKETCGKGKSNAESGTTFEQPVENITEENDEFLNRQHLRDKRESVEGKSRDMNGCKWKVDDRSSLQHCIERHSYVDAVDWRDSYFVPRCRSRQTGALLLRNERELTPERYQGRYKPTCYSERDGVDQWTHWGSRKHHSSIYLGAEARGRTRQRSITSEFPEKFSRLNNYNHRQTSNYVSRGFHRPFMRRSHVERDDSFRMRRRMPRMRGASSRRYYSERAGGDFGEDVVPLPEDDATPARLSHHSSKRERSLSPNPVRIPRMPISARSSLSRSRTPPRIWNSRRGVKLGARRHGRSPQFRYDGRTERGRFAHNKPVFAYEYKENCWSPSRGRCSPQRRWDDDRTFANNSLENRRSPGRIFKRPQRYDSIGSSGRSVYDEDFQPPSHSRRFSFRSSGVREPKLKTSYESRKCDDNSDMMQKGLPLNEGRADDERDVAQTLQTVMEDKTCLKSD